MGTIKIQLAVSKCKTNEYIDFAKKAAISDCWSNEEINAENLNIN